MKTVRLPAFLIVSTILAGSIYCSQAEDHGSALLSAPKLRVSSGQPDVQVATKAGGSYKGSDVYATRATSKQRLARQVSSGAITSYFKVENDSRGLPASPYSIFRISGGGSDPNFAVTYFSQSGANITSSMLRGRYALNIASDSRQILRQRLAPARANVTRGAMGRFAVKAVNKRGNLSDMAETRATKL